MANIGTGKEGWHHAFLHAKQIATEVGLPEGAIKAETNGQYSLTLSHLNEDQIRQMAHLWYVLSHTTLLSHAPKPLNTGKSAS